MDNLHRQYIYRFGLLSKLEELIEGVLRETIIQADSNAVDVFRALLLRAREIKGTGEYIANSDWWLYREQGDKLIEDVRQALLGFVQAQKDAEAKAFRDYVEYTKQNIHPLMREGHIW